jgi:hypothetical protein
MARELRRGLSAPDRLGRLAEVHRVGAASHEVQAVVTEAASPMGFESERTGLFAGYTTAALRPDLYLPLNEARRGGILLEVERGKTLPNNMDLLDLWKCHICREAQYLFLVVPLERHSLQGRMQKTFPRVVERLRTFFVPGNEVNVEAVVVFGY